MCCRKSVGRMRVTWTTVLICLMSSSSAEPRRKRPHIILIMADDLGWNDVSIHGSDQILTPNIDSLGYHGVLLHQHYSQPLCTPSRAALLTGRYPLHTGMQHNLILEPEPWGLPLDLKLLPEFLSDLGYSSHSVGKWHLGYFKSEYTPTHRGFDSHFGFWNGYQDYYKHTVQGSFIDFEGYDLRWNDSVTEEGKGQYSTDLYTEHAVRLISRHDASQPLFLYLAHLAPHAGNYDEPLQAPPEAVEKNSHIPQPERGIYAGMVDKLDESVGKVVEALSKADMLKDSVIVFLSDNGGATNGLHANHGSNWPLKGEKGTLWEGSVRTVACAWSAGMQRSHRVFHQLMHISDWLPTLYSAAGGRPEDLGDIDGVNQWPALVSESRIPVARHEMLHNIDDIAENSAIRVNHLKYVNGTTLLGYLDRWTGNEESPRHLPLNIYAEEVLNSVTTKHLSKFNLNNNKGLTASKIKNIRESVRVRCKFTEENNELSSTQCNPKDGPCIFNIFKDPCEQENLYEMFKGTGIIEDFENRLRRQRKGAREPQNKPPDPKANPSLHNNTWVSWQD